MDKEIKYRAWDKKKKVYLYFTLHQALTLNFNLSYERYRNCVIERYTGLKDFNGKDIYEGDVIKGINRRFPEKKDVIDVVQFGQLPAEQFDVLELNAFFCKKMNANYEIEIIGSIYKNPELMKDNV